MKILILVVALFATQNSFAQNVQTFAKEQFSISSPCKLTRNEQFIKMVKERGGNNILNAFVCAENESNFETAALININIYDLSAKYKSTPKAKFETNYLDTYKADLSKAGYSFKATTLNGLNAIEYEFDQNGLPTKAIMFIYNKKSYLLQIGTRKNLALKFNNLKKSFKTI